MFTVSLLVDVSTRSYFESRVQYFEFNLMTSLSLYPASLKFNLLVPHMVFHLECTPWNRTENITFVSFKSIHECFFDFEMNGRVHSRAVNIVANEYEREYEREFQIKFKIFESNGRIWLINIFLHLVWWYDTFSADLHRASYNTRPFVPWGSRNIKTQDMYAFLQISKEKPGPAW